MKVQDILPEPPARATCTIFAVAVECSDSSIESDFGFGGVLTIRFVLDNLNDSIQERITIQEMGIRLQYKLPSATLRLESGK
jgi:hypothetical protein